jgi:hypothetical protein
MAQRAVLAVSAAITAFIFVLALGVSSVIGQRAATPGTTTAAVQPTVATVADTGASASPGAGLDAGPISQSQAAAIARTYLGGGAVARVDLRNAGGTPVYVVTFADGQAVYEDATSGQVVSWTGMTSSPGNSVASGERQSSQSSLERVRQGEDHDD